MQLDHHTSVRVRRELGASSARAWRKALPRTRSSSQRHKALPRDTRLFPPSSKHIYPLATVLTASEDRVWSKGGEDVTVRLSRFPSYLVRRSVPSAFLFILLPPSLSHFYFSFPFSLFSCFHLCLYRLSFRFSFCLPGESPSLFVATTSIVWLFARSAHTPSHTQSASLHQHASTTLTLSLSSLRQRRSCGSSPDTHTVRSRLALFDRSPSRETSVQSLTVVSGPSLRDSTSSDSP